EISIVANPDCEFINESSYSIREEDFEFDFLFFDLPDNDIQCHLAVQSTIDVPYEFYVDVIGYFTLDLDPDEIDMEPKYLLSAPATLYGIARDMLGTLTANGPFGRTLLPMLDITTFIHNNSDDSIGPEKQTTQKKTTQKKTSSKKSTKKKATRKKS
ncbi:hypothetical protein K8I31_16845, partial [bacterium]|nr:hypothetical protein [bacterium]